MTGVSTEQAVRDELVALLRYANKSEVARALGVTPQAVINWSEGRNTSPARLLQVRRLYGLPDITKEAAPPEWAERQAANLEAVYGLLRLTAVTGGVASELVQEIEAARLDALEQARDERRRAARHPTADPGPRDG